RVRSRGSSMDRKPAPGRWKALLALLLLAGALTGSRSEIPAADTSLPVRVNNPRTLGTWQLAAERVAVGEACKPSRALLPGGRRPHLAAPAVRARGLPRPCRGDVQP